jgi:hypothetical protein
MWATAWWRLIKLNNAALMAIGWHANARVDFLVHETISFTHSIE